MTNSKQKRRGHKKSQYTNHLKKNQYQKSEVRVCYAPPILAGSICFDICCFCQTEIFHKLRNPGFRYHNLQARIQEFSSGGGVGWGLSDLLGFFLTRKKDGKRG